jgi:antitoxin YefM
MKSVTYSTARKQLKQILDLAIDDATPVLITTKRSKSAVVVSQDEWDSVMETLYLSSGHNFSRIQQAMSGSGSRIDVAGVSDIDRLIV